MSAAATWDVVTTVKAGEAQIMAFCNHYLALGASRIFLFLDDPSFRLNPANPRITCHGVSAHNRPEGIEERQCKNATLAAKTSGSDWILHCDIDEYLDALAPVAELLAGIAPQIGSVLVAPAEPIYQDFPESLADILAARYFRVKTASSAAEQFWQEKQGDLYPLTNSGFWAHRRGKSFYRTALARSGRKIPLHGFRGERVKRLGRAELPQLCLRHFDALDFGQWLEKHLSRAEGRVYAPEAGDKRMRMAQLVQKAHAEDQARALFWRMMGLDAESLALGLKKGFIKERPALPLAAK